MSTRFSKMSIQFCWVVVEAGGVLSAVTPVHAQQVGTLGVQGGCPIRIPVR